MMRPLRTLSLCAFAASMLCASAAMAESAAATVRIVTAIDENQLTTLRGNTHPAANAKNDLGRVADSLPMTDLILVLSRSPQQQAAFESFVASQYDSNSPNFHQWLTPQQVGENFGPSQTDIATISGWLTGHGFTVTQVTPDRMSIRFNGTAAQVQSAFHTEIHNLLVKGVQHIGNMSDPQIPTALTPVVVGVKSLHNFFPRPLHRLGSTVTKDSATGLWKRPGNPAKTSSGLAPFVANPGASEAATAAARTKPQFGISVGGSSPYLVEDVAPYDFATIYNILPLWNKGIDGTGQTIAIAGTSSIDLTDVATFRNFFGLPTNNSYNTPIVKSGNSQPVTECNNTTNNLCNEDDLIENSLDVEWSGSVAKNAQIILVSSFPASASDDNLYDSESYIVSNATARIMNVSYGECELALGTAGNVQYYDLWQSAAAEGISVFVAAGDSGSASCDDGSDSQYGTPWSAQYGTTVSGLASTPWNTAVGGTDFNWCSLTTALCTAAPYWSTTNNSSAGQSTALNYVPEVPWNDTCTSPLALGFIQEIASDIGVSGVTDAETACNFSANYNNRLTTYDDYGFDPGELVDTVGGSGGASGCIVNSTPSTITNTTIGTCTNGATSTGTTTNPDTNASQASLTVVNNGWPKPSWQTGVTGIPSDGVRDIPDLSFFASDGFLSSSAYLICVSYVTPCAYSTRGNEPTAEEVGGTSVATPAMAGVMALINQKIGGAQGLANPELYKLAATQTYSSCKAESATVGNGCLFNDVDTGTNAMACDYGAAEGDTGAGSTSVIAGILSPDCTVIHSGDTIGILNGYSATAGYDEATGLGSLNVANVVNAWSAAVGTSAATVTVTPASSSITSNQTLMVTVTVASTANGGITPTGSVTLSGGGYTSSPVSLSSGGTATFSIPAAGLAAGSDTLTANYSGDSLYAASSGSAVVTVTVNGSGIMPTVTVVPSATTLNSSASLTVAVTVSGPSGAVTPSGTVTLSGGGYTSQPEMLTNGAYTFTIPGGSLTTAGTDTLTVTYSSTDAVYGTATGTAMVTVTESTFSLTTPAIVVAPTSIAPGASASATVTVSSVAGYSGTVTLTCAEVSPSPTTGDGATCTGGGEPGVNLTGSGTSGTVIFTIGTTAPSTASLAYPNVHGKGKGSPSGWVGAGGGAVLAFVLFLGIPARRRSWRAMVGMVMLMAALGAMSACGGSSTNGGGGGGTSDPGTTAGTYTFQVNATGNPSVTPSVSTTFTVTVN